MSFHTNKPVEQDKLFIRFYRWADPNKGWGDAGTHKYIELSIDDFEMEEREAFDGSPYYVYNLIWERGRDLFPNAKPWHMSFGYELSSREEQEKEINELKEMIEKIS